MHRCLTGILTINLITLFLVQCSLDLRSLVTRTFIRQNEDFGGMSIRLAGALADEGKAFAPNVAKPMQYVDVSICDDDRDFRIFECKQPRLRSVF